MSPSGRGPAAWLIAARNSRYCNVGSVTDNVPIPSTGTVVCTARWPKRRAAASSSVSEARISFHRPAASFASFGDAPLAASTRSAMSVSVAFCGGLFTASASASAASGVIAPAATASDRSLDFPNADPELLFAFRVAVGGLGGPGQPVGHVPIPGAGPVLVRGGVGDESCLGDLHLVQQVLAGQDRLTAIGAVVNACAHPDGHVGGPFQECDSWFHGSHHSRTYVRLSTLDTHVSYGSPGLHVHLSRPAPAVHPLPPNPRPVGSGHHQSDSSRWTHGGPARRPYRCPKPARRGGRRADRCMLLGAHIRSYLVDARSDCTVVEHHRGVDHRRPRAVPEPRWRIAEPLSRTTGSRSVHHGDVHTDAHLYRARRMAEHGGSPGQLPAHPSGRRPPRSQRNHQRLHRRVLVHRRAAALRGCA